MSKHNSLGFAARHALAELVKAEYIGARVNDDEFAAMASKKLGSDFTANNVVGVRRALGIQSFRDLKIQEAKAEAERKAKMAAAQQAPADGLHERLMAAELRNRVDALERVVAALMRELSYKPAGLEFGPAHANGHAANLTSVAGG